MSNASNGKRHTILCYLLFCQFYSILHRRNDNVNKMEINEFNGVKEMVNKTGPIVRSFLALQCYPNTLTRSEMNVVSEFGGEATGRQQHTHRREEEKENSCRKFE